MIETALHQFRFALSTLMGHPFRLRSLDRVVDAMLATYREFGAIGADADELVRGPALDAEVVEELQRRRFRRQAKCALETPYYRPLLERLGSCRARELPPTPKAALREQPDAFVRRGTDPGLRALTTGTTGRPTSVYFSHAELEAGAALTAIDLLLRRQVTPADVVQLCTSSRGLLPVMVAARACARIGAAVYQAGLVDPAHALALLAERRSLAGRKPRVSVLTLTSSYLGALVEQGTALGYTRADFGLERIICGGEILTAGLRARSASLFGDVEIVDQYAATETVPVGAVPCTHGHLHFAPTSGLVEVVRDDGSQAQAGELGSLVVTPFPPFRTTTILLRYDTEDLVRVPDEPPRCELAGLPATGAVLGKRRLCVNTARGMVTQRAVLEALEGDDAVPLPARYGFRAAGGGISIEVAVRRVDAATRARIGRRLEDAGVPVNALTLVTDPSTLADPIPVRADLRELSFSDYPARTVRAA